MILFEEIDPNITVRLFIEEAMLNGCGIRKELGIIDKLDAALVDTESPSKI